MPRGWQEEGFGADSGALGRKLRKLFNYRYLSISRILRPRPSPAARCCRHGQSRRPWRNFLPDRQRFRLTLARLVRFQGTRHVVGRPVPHPLHSP